MNDEELDKLFRDAANRFQPPDVPEDAWDVFYKTKMLPAGSSIEKRGRWAGLAALLGHFFTPKFSWQFATTCVLALIAGLLLFRTKPPTGNIAGDPAGNITLQPPVAGTRPPAAAETRQEPADAGNSRNDTENNREWNVGERPPADILAGTRVVLPRKPAAFDFSKKPAGALRATPADSIGGRHKMDFSLRRKPGEASPARPGLPDHYRFPQTEPTAGRSNTRSGWQVGLLAGSNLGMVRGDVSKKPGLNAGVLVQKKLGLSRFSIESGVLYESMTYDVNNADFTPNGKPVSSRVSNIEGACTMIDVPVNVRYDVVASKKNKAFVSTGVSPTVIVKQSYVYDYDPGDGPVPVNRDVSGKGKSVYAVANLSVGYEQKWNHVSVQIAPYVKIPMGEIGYGNLSLGGIGTQISIKKDL
ncbi:porin family protein [Niabella aurantiaca]|uniref:porin family protein n=1 Tax=Niabella aurantiaca TaxID=379900 RepID=UPI0003A2ADBC|nr:porin family protein [Niabella aurantiaca]